MFFVVLNRKDALHFRDSDDGQEAAEQQEQGHEDTKASKVHGTVNVGWRVISPRTWKEVTAKRGYGNHESFEPHPDIHEDADDHHKNGDVRIFLNQNNCGEITLQETMIQ